MSIHGSRHDQVLHEFNLSNLVLFFVKGRSPLASGLPLRKILNTKTLNAKLQYAKILKIMCRNSKVIIMCISGPMFFSLIVRF